MVQSRYIGITSIRVQGVQADDRKDISRSTKPHFIMNDLGHGNPDDAHLSASR